MFFTKHLSILPTPNLWTLVYACFFIVIFYLDFRYITKVIKKEERITEILYWFYIIYIVCSLALFSLVFFILKKLNVSSNLYYHLFKYHCQKK